MRRLVVALFAGVALTLPLASAGAATRGGAPSGFEKVEFVEYTVGAAGQKPPADASSNDFHLLGGHPAWGTTDVNYSVNTLGCSGSCSGATAAVDAAFNTWSG